jgi:transcriptional regulator with XRE-family HTH domain
MDYYAIGQRIRKIRKAQGFSQETLAEQAGISVTHMSHIETGNTKLSLPVLVDLAEILDVRTDDLLYDEIFAERSSTIDEIVQILNTCTVQQLKIIKNILKTTKISLEQYL